MIKEKQLKKSVYNKIINQYPEINPEEVIKIIKDREISGPVKTIKIIMNWLIKLDNKPNNIDYNLIKNIIFLEEIELQT